MTIGTVSGITIAPDHRLVQVTSDCYLDSMVRLNLGSEEALRNHEAPVPPDLRVQLATTGITGVKFLLVDFFTNPDDPPPLDFDAPQGYLPSAPSTLKSLEDGFYTLANALPQTLNAITSLAETLERQVDAVDLTTIQAKALDLVTHVDDLVVSANGKLAQVDMPQLAKLLAEDLTALKEAIWKADKLLDQMESAEGPLRRIAADVTTLTERANDLLASTQAAINDSDLPGTTETLRGTIESYGTLANGGQRMFDETEETMVLLRETLAAVQSLAATIERQPGVFLQGRLPDSPRPKIQR